MLISTSHNFIFVHVPKSAGTSVTEILQPFCLPRNRALLRRISSFLPLREDPERAHFRHHETAARMRAKLGAEVFDGFFSFAVVRNPFDHAVSVYEFLKAQQGRNSARVLAAMSFGEFMRLRVRPQRFAVEESPLHMRDQASRLVDATGRLLVSRVLRLENLAAEFPVLCAELKLPAVPMSYRNISKRQPIETYYDAASVALVRSHYSRDFALFGYADTPDFDINGG